MTHDKARIWFVTDIHGSNKCFEKFLNLVNHSNKPNVLVIGGDITGKHIVPIVQDRNSNLFVPIRGERAKFPSAEIANIKKRFSDVGYYPYECTEQQYDNLKSESVFRTVFDHLVKQRMSEWVAQADRKLPPPDICRVLINAGNDDPLYIDEILDRSKRLTRPEGKVVDLPCGLQMLSTGYSNTTPWHCPRDVDDNDLARRIKSMASQVTSNDFRKVIFNFHCPPFGTALDVADKIDPITFQKLASLKGAAKEHVGSKAVRDSIEKLQPTLSLHGHIHEVRAKERLGNTLCINPGTDFRNGNLQAFFAVINASGEIEFEILTEEREIETDDTPLIEGILRQIPFVGPFINRQLDTKGARDRHSELLKKIDEIKKALNRTTPISGPPSVSGDTDSAAASMEAATTPESTRKNTETLEQKNADSGGR